MMCASSGERLVTTAGWEHGGGGQEMGDLGAAGAQQVDLSPRNAPTQLGLGPLLHAAVAASRP